MTKRISLRFAKYLSVSLAIFVAVTILALLFAYIRLGFPWPIYVFNANYVIGVIITFIGVAALYGPAKQVWTTDMRLYDQAHFVREKAIKGDNGATKYFIIGLGLLAITTLAQYLLGIIW